MRVLPTIEAANPEIAEKLASLVDVGAGTTGGVDQLSLQRQRMFIDVTGALVPVCW